MNKVTVKECLPRANSVDGFLKLQVGHSPIPNSSATSFATFTHYNVTCFQPEAILLVILERHQLQVRRIDLKPPHIWISKVRHWPPFVFLCIEHFSETLFGYVG
jgi:hypothetical protein